MDTRVPFIKVTAFRHTYVVALFVLVVAVAAVQLGCIGGWLSDSDEVAGTPLGDVRYPTAPPPNESYVVAGAPVRLTWTDVHERDPVWSPDGRRIASVCQVIRRWARIGEVMNRPITPSVYITSNICVMNANGSGIERLDAVGCCDADPSWSPDGRRIALSTSRGRNAGDIYIDDIYLMNRNGSGMRRITDSEYSSHGPAWSPDGSKIAYFSRSGGQRSIYVMNADGSNPTRVTGARSGDGEPSWSPDGTQIAFATGRTYDLRAIYVINLDGSGERLVHTSGGSESPAWSPDGERIAFASDVWEDGVQNREIFVVNVDGTGLTRLTNRPNRDSDPAWSPDGRRIVFTSDLVGNSEIYVMEVEP